MYLKFLVLLVLLIPQVFGQAVKRYIVELSTEPVTAHVARQQSKAELRSAEAQAQRSRIQNEQDAVQTAVQETGATVLDRVDTVANALIVKTSDPSGLASIPGVRKVYPSRTFKLLLDRAVVQHRVVDVWNQVGANKAGAGIKIGIIDTGIDITHPAFQDASLTAPDGFPKVSSTRDLANTNGKVIVARNYVSLLDSNDIDYSAQDHVGHGTALGMIAAGVRNTGPLATIEGVAPRAFLGVYKVFGTPGYNSGASEAAILKAIDDAVADGMDVINISLGSTTAPRLADDIEAQALERAVKAGVIVVVAAGNSGTDPNTISSPATAPSVITAGASTNDRVFADVVEVSGLAPAYGLPAAGAASGSSVSGPLADVAALDGNGLACTSLPSGSLSGKIALILRGSCLFEVKLNNVQQAGGIGGIIYTADAATAPFSFGPGTATLPALMVEHNAGRAFAQRIASDGGTTATLKFVVSGVLIAGNKIADFSATGPNVDIGIKPDLMAVGDNFYMATQTYDPNGSMYDPSGYFEAQGTSFSTPLIAGAAALIKAARPGLTVDQYRSLLVNTGAPLALDSAPGVQSVGAGLLDALGALRSPVTASPVSISFGSSTNPNAFQRTLSITNVGKSAETFTLSTTSLHGDLKPALGTSTVQLDPGASAEVPVSWTGDGLAPGAYDGYITITAASQAVSRVPYWYAVASGTPARITVLFNIDDESPRRGQSINDAIDVRVTDAAGLILTDIPVTATVISGNGAVRRVNNYDEYIPGDFGIDVTLGRTAGPNVFRIRVGDVSIDVTITGR